MQLGFHSFGHVEESLIPAFDNTIFPNLENEWLVPFEAGIELLAIEELTLVVHTHAITLLWLHS